LWDLKARLLDVPLAALLGPARDAVPIYGSGGFTSYGEARLADQLGGWVEELGCRWVKMKVGGEPDRDLDRVRVAREAVGKAQLMVDANGAYGRKQALWFADEFADLGVIWFEEPVSSDDLEGLRLLRDRGLGGLEIAAGEYGYDPFYFRRMLEAGAVDVLQADATRCGGVTGFLAAAALADAHGLPLSAHTAPSLHLAVCCAAPACATSSGSTTTRGLRRCCSRAPRCRGAARSGLTSARPATGSPSGAPTRSGSPPDPRPSVDQGEPSWPKAPRSAGRPKSAAGAGAGPTSCAGRRAGGSPPPPVPRS
jgi:L-alanine-DL-glutamate epimerase-like enolase superfamily enzyme